MNKEKSSEERFREWWMQDNSYHSPNMSIEKSKCLQAWQSQESYWQKREEALQEALEWVFSNPHRQYSIHNGKYGVWQSSKIDVYAKSPLSAIQAAMKSNL